jgi:hypothetical protein
MKRTLLLLLVIALGACNSRHEEAARTMCNKVAVCCKSFNGGVNVVGTICRQAENEAFVLDAVSPTSLIETPTQILGW